MQSGFGVTEPDTGTESSRPIWSTEQLPGQAPRQDRETLSQKNMAKQRAKKFLLPLVIKLYLWVFWFGLWLIHYWNNNLYMRMLCLLILCFKIFCDSLNKKNQHFPTCFNLDRIPKEHINGQKTFAIKLAYIMDAILSPEPIT